MDSTDNQQSIAMNYSRFLNAVSLARKPSPIRLLTALLSRSKPSMISLAGGNPNPEYFPFQEAEFKLRDGTTLRIDEKRMRVALQYGPTPGLDDFVKYLKGLQKTLHNPPTLNRSADKGGMDICVTMGSHDAICKSFEMLVSAGDTVLIEEPTYPGTLAAIRPLGAKLVPVSTDHEGMIPDSLRSALSSYKPPSQGFDPSTPRLLYTIPNGCNPTGGTLTLQRKKEIYQIAREYDLLILEDDPYYFLQFNKPRVPTYLSLDEDGRVLRFDSFSKVLSAGLRVGFVTGPQPLVERIIYHIMSSVVHAPCLNQIMMGDLLQRWGNEGLEKHVDSIIKFYSSQKDVMIAAAEKHLKGLAEWNAPVAGMFLWIKLLGVSDTKKLIEERALEKEVLLVPGSAFMIDSSKATPYIRASYSLASPQQIDQGFERLASLVREAMKK